MHYFMKVLSKKKEKTINVSIAFSIFHKNSIKTFVKWFIIICWSNLYYFNVLYVDIKTKMG